jgi:hypothetical protein
MATASLRRLAGWAAVLSAAAGFAALGFLIAALAAPTPSPTSLRRYETLFRWQDGGVLLQALAMIPVVLGLHATLRTGRRTTVLGLGANACVALAVLLQFADLTWDSLYMLPQGLVGLWLVVINRRAVSPISKGLARTGGVAGFGLLVIGVGTLIHVGLVAPRELLGPLTNAEIDAQSWTLPNVIAHVYLAAGTLLGRTVYPVWTLLLGRALLRQSIGEGRA